MHVLRRVCVRRSCLNPMEPASKHGGEKLEVAVEVVPSAKQDVEKFSAVNSTDVPLVSGPSLSDTSSQEMNSKCEDAKDVEMVDSEASSSALTDLDIHGRCYNEAEGSLSDPEISQGQISEVSSSIITEPKNKKSELPFSVSEVEDKDVAVESSGKQHAVINSVDNKSDPYSYGVYGNGIADHADAFATLNTGEVLNDSHQCSSSGKAEKVKESGKNMPPTQITAVGAANGRNTPGSKPKPLFASGFLEKRPPIKHSKEEDQAPVQIGQLASVCNYNGNGSGPHLLSSCSGKQSAKSEDGATSKFRDSIHVPGDSLDIGNDSSSAGKSIPVGNGSALSSTAPVVLNEAHCFSSEGKPKKLEVDDTLMSLPVTKTKNVSEEGKDGQKYSGSKSKPLLRPGFLGKHPREKNSKQEAVVPAETGNASFHSACKLNVKSSNRYELPGRSNQSMGDSSMGDSEDGESYIGNSSSLDI